MNVKRAQNDGGWGEGAGQAVGMPNAERHTPALSLAPPPSLVLRGRNSGPRRRT